MNKRNSRLSMLGKVNTGPCNHGKSVWGPTEQAVPSVEESTNPEKETANITERG